MMNQEIKKRIDFFVCEFCTGTCEVHYDDLEENQPNFCPFCGEEQEEDMFMEVTEEVEYDEDDDED